MSLNITIKEGRHISEKKKDAKVVFKFLGISKESVATATEPVVWNRSFKWNLNKEPSVTDEIEVKVYHKSGMISNKFVGMGSIRMKSVMLHKTLSPSLTLCTKVGDPLKAEIDIEITFTPKRGWESYNATPERSTEQTNQKVKKEEKSLQQSVSSKAMLAKVRETTPSNSHYRLPNKPTSFQVRVHVIQGRGLVGERMDPMVKVKCGKHIRQTLRTKGTYNPFFDEILQFSFYTTPDELFDTVIVFMTLNSRLHFLQSVVGSYKLDVRFVYDQPNHCFIHKWLLLTDPNDSSCCVKGYLKVSVNVIGPGDIPVSSPSIMTPETVDVEDNLLRPSGVQVQKGTLYVRLYLAEHLPQMDPEYLETMKRVFRLSSVKKEDLVDPYCKVSFAGYHCQTKTIKNQRAPFWNQQINFPISIPSLCDRIRIQLIDEDDGSADDYIGTCYVNLKEISDPNGYHPLFGPSFINVYGSPREFSALPNKYEYMNEGMMKGVSYRGRVLVEIGVYKEILPKENKEIKDISPADISYADGFRSRKNFKLLATFLSANMIRPGNTVIEFEVSIGIYGNKSENFAGSQSSTTPPVTPVLEKDCKYHCIPWGLYKPCVVIGSQWEDTIYRMEAQNMILYFANDLEKDLRKLKQKMATSARICTDTQVMSLINMLRSLRNEIVEMLDGKIVANKLPSLPAKPTFLDVKKKKIREEQLREILKDIKELLKKQNHDLISLLHDAEGFYLRLLQLANEPQNNVPDVIIWMLAGDKRVACCRIPTHRLLYSENIRRKGSLGGIIQDIFLKHPGMEKNEQLDNVDSPGALIRCQMWFGLVKDEFNFQFSDSEGRIGIYAETYQNESLHTIKLRVPEWSDASGKIHLPPTQFNLPQSWTWVDKTFIPRKEFSIPIELKMEEMYEYQTREPFKDWSSAESSWHDINGQELTDYNPHHENQTLAFKETSSKRASDENGWEYSIDDNNHWVPYENNDHNCRRRLYIRKRKNTVDTEGWEYSSCSFKGPFHSTHDKYDVFKRRRELRQMAPLDAVQLYQLPVFNFKAERDFSFMFWRKQDEEEDVNKQQSPRVYLSFKKIHYCQLRAHLYQARDLYAGDTTGLSDPYCLVTFDKYTMRSVAKHQTLCPMWNQTLVFKEVILYGDRASILKHPPPVVIELIDKDTWKHDYLGRVVCAPVVRTRDSSSPSLTWFEVERYGQPCGDLLAVFELFMLEEIKPTETLVMNENNIFQLPKSIYPRHVEKRIEILCWGIRDMKRISHVVKIDTPLLEVQCGEETRRSSQIKNAQTNSNFVDAIISMDVRIPENEDYAPPLILRLLDNQGFGYCPVVGVNVLKSLRDYSLSEHEKRILPLLSLEKQTDFQQEEKLDEKDSNEIKDEEQETLSDPDRYVFDYDWWSKYYAAVTCKENLKEIEKRYLKDNQPTIKFFDRELETFFNGFSDVIQTFSLYRGKGMRDLFGFGSEPIGYFKGKVRAYDAPTHVSPGPANAIGVVPSSAPVKIIVRVYVVEGIDLQPRDLNGKSDPYLVVKTGKSEKNNKDRYISNQLNPLFGEFFELQATLPHDYKLKIKVMDHDMGSLPDLIGETTIDLENRWLSKHRATCGISEVYLSRGPNQWRDVEKPSNILDWYCKIHRLPSPIWKSTRDNPQVTLWHSGSLKTHYYNEEPTTNNPDLGSQKEQLALRVIKRFTAPPKESTDITTELELVPEHIETRQLTHPSHPGFSQGYLRMWVDLFPADVSLPPPVNISRRKPVDHILRIVIYNTKKVKLVETSVTTGEDMTDIYVKGWIAGENKTQKTDVHYRSMDGEGNFNWRFVFPFKYLPNENEIVVDQKDHFYSVKKTERRLPPLAMIQLWDNNIVLPNKYIGTLNLNLTALPSPVDDSSKCSLQQVDPSNCVDNLFYKRRSSGWFQLYSKNNKGEKIKTGTVQMELEVISVEEEQIRPAGKGREEPNSNPRLDDPIRPSTSFLWLTSPLKTFKFIVWKYYKWNIILALAVILGLLAAGLFIFSFPKFIAEYTLNHLLPFTN